MNVINICLYVCLSIYANILIKDGPQLTFIDNRCIDIGYVEEGSIQELTFRIKNTGNFPLAITDSFPTCNCTGVHYDRNAFAPGEEGEITIKIDTSGKLGKQTVVVRIVTNTDIGSYVIRVDMNVNRNK